MGGKALFFFSLDFNRDRWQALANALQKLAIESSVIKTLETAHGTKYVLDGTIETPGGGTALVRTIWILDKKRDRPRLVTAYPRER